MPDVEWFLIACDEDSSTSLVPVHDVVYDPNTIEKNCIPHQGST